MILWFAGLAVVIVWQLLHDPAIDYRLLVAGALAPDAIDAVSGGTGLLHTLVFSVALLVAVMVGTRGRRRLRRRLLALPFGTFLHLVLDAMWARQRVFWWPFLGTRLTGGVPSLGRPLPLLVLQEVAGAAALWWFAGRFRLLAPEHRRRFLTTGRLSRELAAPREP